MADDFAELRRASRALAEGLGRCAGLEGRDFADFVERTTAALIFGAADATADISEELEQARGAKC